MDKTIPGMPELKELDAIHTDGTEGLQAVRSLLDNLQKYTHDFDMNDKGELQTVCAIEKAQQGIDRADSALSGLYCKAFHAIKLANRDAAAAVDDLVADIFFPAQCVKALLDTIEGKIWSCVSMLKQSAAAMAVSTVELACRDLTAAQTLCAIAEEYAADMEKTLEAVT